MRPTIAATAYVASTAVISGDVVVHEGACVMHGAVLSAEDGRIEVGRRTVVLEGALLRGRAGHFCLVGDDVMIGPGAHVNGAHVGREVFIATGASLFPGSTVGDGCELRINSVLQVNSLLAAGQVVPIGWVAVGNPAELFPPDRHDEIWAIQQSLNFPATVYGVAPGATMKDIMAAQSDFYRVHTSDVELT